MIRIFQTGDNHFGLKYHRYPDAKEKLVECRYEALQNCVRCAEGEKCDFIVVTGDLFDKIAVAQKVVKRVVGILEEFNGTVLVIPGNHDYYTEEVEVWQHFRKSMTKGNVLLLDEGKPYEFDCDSGERLAVYPAICDSKHSSENKLQWIKDTDFSQSPQGADYRIGIAHGAIRGVTPDLKQEYFPMGIDELDKVAVDAWLIGHTHIPYPNLGVEDRDACETGRIYNAGTHQQTDLGNNAEGCGFVITLSRDGDDRSVRAHAVQTGVVRFADLEIRVTPESGDLKRVLSSQLAGFDLRSTVVRASLKGTLSRDAYARWRKDFEDVRSECLAAEADDADLSEELTMERIREEFPEMGAPYKLLERLTGDSKEMQMAYELISVCNAKGARG